MFPGDSGQLQCAVNSIDKYQKPDFKKHPGVIGSGSATFLFYRQRKDRHFLLLMKPEIRSVKYPVMNHKSGKESISATNFIIAALK